MIPLNSIYRLVFVMKTGVCSLRGSRYLHSVCNYLSGILSHFHENLAVTEHVLTSIKTWHSLDETFVWRSECCHGPIRSHAFGWNQTFAGLSLHNWSRSADDHKANAQDGNDVCCQALVIYCSNICNTSLSHTTCLHLKPCQRTTYYMCGVRDAWESFAAWR